MKNKIVTILLLTLLVASCLFVLCSCKNKPPQGANNQTNGNKDLEIAKICEYAFRKFLGANTNLLTLACIQRTKEDILPDIKQILQEDTNYFNIMGEFEE